MTSLDQAPIAAPDALDGKIPVIDLSRPRAEVVAALDRACRDWGFFQVVGHGVDPALREAVLDEMRAFFARPKADKRALARDRDNPWGYYDRELTKNTRDKKEVFDVGPEVDASARALDPDAFSGSTRWPADGSQFEPLMRAWFEACEGVSIQLTDAIAEALGDTDGALAATFQPHNTSFMRLNYYPVEDPLEDEAATRDAMGAAPRGVHHHSDSGAVTVLMQDSVGGLQVLRDGVWHGVDPLPDAFVINIGDAMQVWSNDQYPAPIHRVLAMEQADRYSIPFFHNPAYRAVIQPIDAALKHTGQARYRPYGWGEFRRKRADGDFADYGAEIQISDFRIA